MIAMIEPMAPATSPGSGSLMIFSITKISTVVMGALMAPARPPACS